MKADVFQIFGDVKQTAADCKSSVIADADWSTKKTACLSPSMAATSNFDWSTWLAQWTDFANTNNGSDDLHVRPSGYSLMNENTTTYGSWIEIQNMTHVSNTYNPIVNNVSLAMPNAGVFDATNNPENILPRPNGSYNLHASVVSPAVNVICAEMTKDELAPIVYKEWPNSDKSLDFSLWVSTYASAPKYVPSNTSTEWLNRTIVDPIFGFGPEFGQRRPPIFPVLPVAYNTLTNKIGTYAPLPNRDAVYIIDGNPDPSNFSSPNAASYSLCQVRAYRTPYCSTWLSSTSSKTQMGAICEESNDRLQFAKNAVPRINPTGNATTSLLWVDMADVWVDSGGLGAGITNGSASNARLLTQFFPTERKLNAKMSSMAEALAAMAANTIITGSRNSSMLDTVDRNLPPDHTQDFQAEIQSQQYGSGATEPYQNVFFIVLIAVFGGNVLVFTWFIFNRGLVTDFCDPVNMFSLKINSPPSALLAGSCGCGPNGKQYGAKWFLNLDGDPVFLENDEKEQELAENRARQKPVPESPSVIPSPITQTYSKLSTRKSIL